jgi:hypothetical protein
VLARRVLTFFHRCRVLPGPDTRQCRAHETRPKCRVRPSAGDERRLRTPSR